MLLALAMSAATAHAGIPAGFGGTPGIVNEARRTTTSSCCTTTGRRRGRTSASPSVPSVSPPRPKGLQMFTDDGVEHRVLRVASRMRAMGMPHAHR